MSDPPFYEPNHRIPPRQPRGGESLWTIQKDGRHLTCELRDDGEWAVELRKKRVVRGPLRDADPLRAG